MIFKALIVCTLVVILQQGCLANLQHLASNGDCQFYNELETVKRCGQTGYLLAYGGKYCRKFGENIASFNGDVRHCKFFSQDSKAHFYIIDRENTGSIVSASV